MIKKIKHHWKTDAESRQNYPAAILIGAPDDRGVLNVGGRIGTSHGPQAVRQMLSGFLLGIDHSLERLDLLQGFDIETGSNIESGHKALRDAVAVSLSRNVVPVVIGGGHDYGYPHAGGAFDVFKDQGIALINVDAHLDVRPPGPAGITSGSPFFLALEEGIVKPKNFVEFGIQAHCNDYSFADYIEKKGAHLISLNEARAGKGAVENFAKILKKFSKQGLKTVVSFDVDSVQMAYAPGVSAPQTDGFTATDFLEMARICGEDANVATVGFFELVPLLDESVKTTRLVTTAIHRFLSGISRRGAKSRRRLVQSLLLGR